MDFANTYGLLVAVSAPVSILMGMNAWLWLTGERGTLLLPSSEGWPSMRVEAAAAVEPAPAPAPAPDAANDEPYRLAA